jgi:cytoskeletal protein CcmA (bactofilin family)
MESPQTSRPDSTLSSPPLLVVRGSSALLEGSFDIEDSIEVECELRGELTCGGTLVIGQQGRVSADVTTVNAVILGEYTGKMTASGSIEIAATGRANGTLSSHELVIAKGGLFTGSVAHMDDGAESSATMASDTSASRGKQTEQPSANRSGSQSNGPGSTQQKPTRLPNQLGDSGRAGAPVLADVVSTEPDRSSTKERSRPQEVPLS